MFKHPFSFDGCIGRPEYAIAYVAYMALFISIDSIGESRLKKHL
jgi:hypothetical protein